MKKLFVLALALCLLCSCALAADYPTRSIETQVGYAAGGASDIIARIVAEHLSTELGQPVVVQNYAGAGGEIAYTGVATARKDGYTLGYINAPATMSIPLSRKAAYTMDDFAFIGNVIYHENLIVVSPDGPYKTIDDLFAAAKANPGTITLGNSGAYADDHLASLKMQHETGITFTDTMFQGSAPSLVALMGNHIDSVVCNVADVVQKSKDGQVVVLATMGAERNPLFPDAPTLKELGYDVLMGNYTTMSVADIDAFLHAHGNCDNRDYCHNRHIQVLLVERHAAGARYYFKRASAKIAR